MKPGLFLGMGLLIGGLIGYQWGAQTRPHPADFPDAAKSREDSERQNTPPVASEKPSASTAPVLEPPTAVSEKAVAAPSPTPLPLTDQSQWGEDLVVQMKAEMERFPDIDPPESLAEFTGKTETSHRREGDYDVRELFGPNGDLVEQKYTHPSGAEMKKLFHPDGAVKGKQFTDRDNNRVALWYNKDGDLKNEILQMASGEKVITVFDQQNNPSEKWLVNQAGEKRRIFPPY